MKKSATKNKKPINSEKELKKLFVHQENVTIARTGFSKTIHVTLNPKKIR